VVAAFYLPAHEFAEVVALLVGAADDDADLSMVRIVRTDQGRYVHFETRTPRAFFGPGRTRVTALRNALAEKLGAPELRLTVGYPGKDEATP
jgi:ribosomal protein S3